MENNTIMVDYQYICYSIEHMKLHDIITIIQVLSGAVLLLFSVFLGLKTKKDVPKDLKGKWLAVISFMIFFIVCYILFVFILLRLRIFSA